MPKTRVIKKTVYTFDELSDKAKEKARDWYRQGNCEDSFWSEGVLDQAEEVSVMLGIDLCQTPYKTIGGETRYKATIYFSGFWSQGDGACFEGTWDASKVRADALKKEWPTDKELHRIADGFAEVAKEYPEGAFSVKHTGHYSHSHSTSFDVELNDPKENDLEYDSTEWSVAATKWREDEETLIELARDFMDWIYKQLEKEWDYQNSDEQVDESIKCNEYEFSEDGSIA